MGKYKGIDGYLKSIGYTAGQIKTRYDKVVKDANEAFAEGYRQGQMEGQVDADCDTCVYHDMGWDFELCDVCTENHSNYKRDKFCVCLGAEQLAEIEDEFGSAVVRKIREMGV